MKKVSEIILFNINNIFCILLKYIINISKIIYLISYKYLLDFIKFVV